MRLLLTTLLVALLGSGCAAKKDVEELPAELTKIEPALDVRLAWSAKVGDESENLQLSLVPSTDGTLVYAAAHDGTVGAWALADGKRKWQVELGLQLSAGPVYDSDILVLGTSDGDLVALTASDGSERWRIALGSEVLARPAVARDVIVVRTVDGRLRGLASADGAELWTRQHEVPRLSLRGNAAPAISGTRVVAGFDDGQIVALNLRTGSVLWELPIAAQRGRTELERLADVDADLRLVGNDVYAVGYQSRIAMIGVDTGQVAWTKETSSFRAPGVDWTNVYVSDVNGEVTAYDRRSGNELWRQASLRLRKLSGPAPHGNAVVVGDFEGYLHWLSSADGSFLARARFGKQAIGVPPLLVGDTLLVQSDGGQIGAYRIRVAGN